VKDSKIDGAYAVFGEEKKGYKGYGGETWW